MLKNKYIKHGLSKHPLYKCYYRIKGRCNNKKDYDYKYYGGRGIKCMWNNFLDFYKDMKDSYKDKLEIDRIDNNGNYCKENCRWATRKEQNRNKRNNKYVFINNKRYTISELAEQYSLNVSTLKRRFNCGYRNEDLLSKNRLNVKLINGKTIREISKLLGITNTAFYYRIKKMGIKKALETPIDKNKGIFQSKIFIKYNNKKYTIKELSKKFNIKDDTLRNRLYRLNMPLEKALTKKV